MDPLTSLAFVVARYGADKVIRALFGDDVGELAGKILGVVTQMEESQSRLLEIERQLGVLIDQRYLATLGAGTRYLRQSTLPNRSRELRLDDLQKAEDALVDAAHSAPTPLQRAHSERMLVLVRLSKGDTSGALDAWQGFDISVGDAANQAFQRFHAPEGDARRLIENGEFGRETAMDRVYRVVVGDMRWNSAVHRARREAVLALKEVNVLLGDDLAASQLLGVHEMPFAYPPFPSPFSLQRQSLFRFSSSQGEVAHNSWNGRQIIDVPPHVLTTLGGARCTLTGVMQEGDTPVLTIEADVALDRRRESEALAWVGVGTDPWQRESAEAPPPMKVKVVRVGAECRIQAQQEWRGTPPSRVYALVGGLVFSGLVDNPSA